MKINLELLFERGQCLDWLGPRSWGIPPRKILQDKAGGRREKVRVRTGNGDVQIKPGCTRPKCPSETKETARMSCETMTSSPHVSLVVVLELLLVSNDCSCYSLHWSKNEHRELSSSGEKSLTNRSLGDDGWLDEMDRRPEEELPILSVVVDRERKGREDNGLRRTEKASLWIESSWTYRRRGVEAAGRNSKPLSQRPPES